MDKTTQGQEGPATQTVKVDAAALCHIKDIALDLFRHSTGQVNDRLLLFQALHTYLVRHGVRPGFTVEAKK